MRPTLSVIVPVYNGASTLAVCLNTLQKGEQAPNQLIVVDDGSRDDSATIARTKGATVVSRSEGPAGPAEARNRGAEQATGDILVFIDADVRVHADTLRQIADYFSEHPEVDALFGSYDDAPTVRTLVSRYANLRHHFVHQHGKREAGTFWSGCGAVRRSAFRVVNGFDVRRFPYPSMEDVDLGYRLIAAGYRIHLVPEIQAKHLKCWTLNRLIRTEIFARAIPWTRLLQEDKKQRPADLNLRWQHRVSGLIALLGFLLLPTSLFYPNVLLVLPFVFLAIALLNLPLFAFFYRKGGILFCLGCLLLHTLHLFYSSLTFILVTLLCKTGFFKEQSHVTAA
jgi:GT2 family glycosyltransferase